jgi:hypothetical protein
MSKTSSLLAILCLILITACGKSGSSQPEKQPTIQTITGLSHLEATGAQTLYSPCTPDRGNVSVIHKLRMTSNGAGSDFEWTASYFTPNCKIAVTDVVLKGHGVFQDNENKRMEATLSSGHFISRNDVMTAEYNKQGSCQRHQWQTHMSMDVLNTSCLKNPKNDFYFDVKGDTVVIYSCDNQQPLGKDCDKTQFKKI